jgi:hypothetical protein
VENSMESFLKILKMYVILNSLSDLIILLSHPYNSSSDISSTVFSVLVCLEIFCGKYEVIGESNR